MGSDDPPRDEPGSRLGIPEALRRAFSAGMPKEAVDYIRSQAHQTKEEAARIMAKEVRDFLERADFPDLVRRVLSNLKVEIKAEVKFKPDNEGAKGEAKGRDEAGAKDEAEVKDEGGGRSRAETRGPLDEG